MAFVFTSWYIVLAVLLVAAIALIAVFVVMDKKDRVIIDKFIAEATANQPAEQGANPEVKPVEDKKE